MRSKHMVREFARAIRIEICRRKGPDSPLAKKVDEVLSRLEDRVRGDIDICDFELKRIAADAGLVGPLHADD